MRITLNELEYCQRNKIKLEDFIKQREKLKRQKAQLAKLIDKRYDLEDALDVLEDEAGSERWKRKKEELEEINTKIEKLWEKM